MLGGVARSEYMPYAAVTPMSGAPLTAIAVMDG